jgi:hypothetical protein
MTKAELKKDINFDILYNKLEKLNFFYLFVINIFAKIVLIYLEKKSGTEFAELKNEQN